MARINKRVLTVAVAEMVALVILVLLFAFEALTLRGFGIAVLAVMITAAILFTLVFPRAKKDAELAGVAATAQTMSARKRYILAGVLALWLMFFLWMTREGPWVPRLIGACFLSLLVIGLFIRKPESS
jgi:hypothetical protein